MQELAPPFKYYAFISYRHADNKHEGRQWASWLHQAIETYDVPSSLVGTPMPGGGLIPARLYPIFRDEADLPADADLSGAITKALDSTHLLLVLCSPRAVQSTYVADEIDYFKKNGGSHRVIAAIIDGEPNASLDEGKQSQGVSLADECFPTPLQFEYIDGIRSDKRAEPVAADFRVNEGGRSSEGWTSPQAYRLALKAQGVAALDIDKRVAAYEKQLHLMLLKIIAGILGVPLSTLTQRDKEHQLAKERQRALTLRRWLAAVSVFALFAVGASVFAFLKQQEATQRLIEQMVSRAKTMTMEAEAMLTNGRNLDALSTLIASMPQDIADPEWPISDRAKAALNRALINFNRASSFRGPSDRIKEIKPVTDEKVLLFGSESFAYLYRRDGTLLGSMNNEGRPQFHVKSDGRTLVSAGVVRRQHKDQVYRSYFVSNRMDLETGNTTQVVDVLLERSVSSLDFRFQESVMGQLFLADGERFLVRTWNESNDTLTVIETATGTVVATLALPDHALWANRVNESQILVRTDKQVFVVDINSGTLRKLFQWKGEALCEGETINFNAENSEQDPLLAISRDEQYLMAVFPRIGAGSFSFSGWCLTGWSLSTGAPLPVRAYDDYKDNANDMPRSAEDGTLLGSVWDSNPTIVYQDHKGFPRRVTQLKSEEDAEIALFKNQGNAAQWAAAKGATIRFSEKTQGNIVHGGRLSSLAFSAAGRSLWVAGMDGVIAEYKVGMNINALASGLDNIDQILADEHTIYAIDHVSPSGGAERKVIFSLIDRASLSVRVGEFIAQEKNSDLKASLFGEGWLGITEIGDREINDYDEPILLHRVDSATAAVVKNYRVNTEEGYTPVISKRFAARIDGDKVVTVSLTDGAEKQWALPAGVAPFRVAFVGDRLIVAADSIAHRDQPEKRRIALYLIEPQTESAPAKIVAKQAQSVELDAQDDADGLLVRWDHYVNERDSIGVLRKNGTYHPVKVAWKDEYLHFKLDKKNDHIFVIRSYTDVRTYDFSGTLLAQTPIDADGYGLELGLESQYLAADNTWVSFRSQEECPFTKASGSGSLSIDSTGRYLLDRGQLYDMSTCTVIYDVPATLSGAIKVMEDGSLWMGAGNNLYHVETVNDFEKNYRKAREALSQRY